MHVPSEISQLDGELSCVAFVLLEHFSPLRDKTNLTRSSTKWYYYQTLYTSPHCLLLNIEESAFPAGRQHDKCHTIAGPVLAGYCGADRRRKDALTRAKRLKNRT